MPPTIVHSPHHTDQKYLLEVKQYERYSYVLFFLGCFIVLLCSGKELSHMDPLSSCSRGESTQFDLIMSVCGYSIIVLLHRPCRKHRASVALTAHQRAPPPKKKQVCTTPTRNPPKMGCVHATLPKKSKCICENRRPGAGVGVVVAVGVCAERYSFTHL